MKFSDIPAQCRGCTRLSFKAKAIAKFNTYALQSLKSYGHIQGIHLHEIEARGMMSPFDVTVTSSRRCMYKGRAIFNSHVIDLTSVGEIYDTKCATTICTIENTTSFSWISLSGEPKNNKGKCAKADALSGIIPPFNIFKKSRGA